MAACGAGCVALVAACRAPSFALPFIALSPLAVGALIRTHFDLWPMLLVLAGLAALLRDRHRLGWAALALAFAAKLFAGVLVPIAAVWTLRRAGHPGLASPSVTAGSQSSQSRSSRSPSSRRTNCRKAYSGQLFDRSRSRRWPPRT